jgi:serine/threonine-protein kinase
MPSPDYHDPLRSTDQEPTAVSPAPNVTTDHAPGLSIVNEGSGANVPAKDAGTMVAVPELPATVSIPGYEIETVLGRGGMGVVYKARHLTLKRTVALKMVLAGGHAGPRDLARFRIEAEAVARLSHPNIVQIHEVGEAGGHPYCALEFVEGGSLARKLKGKLLPARETAKLVDTLARAVQFAHSRNVVHRDLKPANVLLAADGTPKITDFGLARQLDADSGQTQAGQVMGTPSYMAPEQASGRSHDAGPAADIYALGAILYECLAGRPPFKGQTVVETLDQVRTQEPVPPSRHQAGVPLDLETICLKCLRKEPEKRYASAAELADDLVRYQRGEPILARPVSVPERLWRWCRRNPGLAGLSAAVVLLLLAVALSSSLLAWRLQLEKNAAETARQEAVRNEIAARENEATANAQRVIAEKNADLARTRNAQAIAEMVGLIEKVDAKLRPPPGVTPDLQALALREKVLDDAMKSLADTARRAEEAGLTRFSMLAAYQKMGDLFRQHGQIEQAARQYRLGCALAERLAKEQPELDQARGNLALMLARLGDIALEADADPRAARDYYGRALATQQDIADHPRNGSYKPVDHKRLLSGYLVKRGTAVLQAGDPEAARADSLTAQALRLEWTAAEPKNVSARSFLSETYFVLGDVYWRLGDAKATHESFGEALRICEDLARLFPRDNGFKFDVATVEGSYGDALLRLGQPAEARARYQRCRELIEPLVAKDAENFPYKAFQALTYYRLATVLGRLKSPGADGLYQEALRLRSQLVQTDPKNAQYRAELPVTLARCGKRAEALEKAAALRREAAGKSAILLPAARAFAVCAAGTGDDAEKKRCAAQAVEALRVAAEKGYSDVAILETDPDLEPIRKEKAFQDWLRDFKQHQAVR